MDRTEPVICSSCTGITGFLLKLNRYNRFFTQAEPLTSGVNRSKKIIALFARTLQHSKSTHAGFVQDAP
jgi:hypothetical protein